MGKLRDSILAIFFFVVVTACSGSSSGQQPAQVRSKANVVCGSVSLPKRPLRYCYQDRANQASKPSPNVFYYFHGLGGSEREIFGPAFEYLLDELEVSLGTDMPVVVGVSVGAGGVVGYEAPEVLATGFSRVEMRFASNKEVRRLIVGLSMGGHSALRIVAQDAKEFLGYAGLCPAIAAFDAHDSGQVAAYKSRNAAHLDVEFFEQALAIYKRELPTKKAWIENNPINWIPSGAYDGIPIFLSVGSEDSVGFYEGVREFKARSDLRPVSSVEVVEVIGGHCTFDPDAFLAFAKRSFSVNLTR